MRHESKTVLMSLHAPVERLSIPEWASQNVDFSLEPSYDTPLHGPYDPDFIPQWKEIAECDTDPAIRECWVLKCSRSGASENAFLNPIRYHVAVDPMPILYISGNIKAVEEFMEERIKLGLKCSLVTRKKLRMARALEYRIKFSDMILQTTWPANKMAFKQAGWARVYIDEYSLVKGTTPGMLRKRTDTYQFSYICGVSSMDAEIKRAGNEDPILLEWKMGDQREWMMIDPKKQKKRFRFEMGGIDTKHGLKWDKKAKHDDGTWDLEKVRASAYYVTPGGTRIENDQRLAIVQTGKWMPFNFNAPKNRRSYRINSFGLPFKSGEFGHIAEEWCRVDNIKHNTSPTSNQYQKALKVFIYEYLAEEWDDKIQRTDEDELANRVGNYDRNERISQSKDFKEFYISKLAEVYLCVDVQQAHLWAGAREWIEGGDSGLLIYDYVVTWADLEKMAKAVDASAVWIDCGYALRRDEVFRYCLEYEGVPTFGSDKLKDLTWTMQDRDPFEGKRGQGKYNVKTVTFDTDFFKSKTQDLIMGRAEQAWYIYKGIDRTYTRQVASEEKVEGEWRQRRGHAQNHLWDVEVIQTLAATVNQLLYPKV